MKLTDAQRREVLDALPTLTCVARRRAAWRRRPELADEYLQEAILGFQDVLRGAAPPAEGDLGRRAYLRCLGRMKDLDQRERRLVPVTDDELHEAACERSEGEPDLRASIRAHIGARVAEAAARTPDVELRHLVARIRALVETLPERDQALLGGFLFEELSREELAARMGKEISWCNRMLAGALARLRKRIVDAGLFEAVADVIPLRPRR